MLLSLEDALQQGGVPLRELVKHVLYQFLSGVFSTERYIQQCRNAMVEYEMADSASPKLFRKMTLIKLRCFVFRALSLRSLYTGFCFFVPP